MRQKIISNGCKKKTSNVPSPRLFRVGREEMLDIECVRVRGGGEEAGEPKKRRWLRKEGGKKRRMGQKQIGPGKRSHPLLLLLLLPLSFGVRLVSSICCCLRLLPSSLPSFLPSFLCSPQCEQMPLKSGVMAVVEKSEEEEEEEDSLHLPLPPSPPPPFCRPVPPAAVGGGGCDGGDFQEKGGGGGEEEGGGGGGGDGSAGDWHLSLCLPVRSFVRSAAAAARW